MKKSILLLLVLGLFSCKNKSQIFLESAFDIMEKNSIKKEMIDWGKLRKSAHDRLDRNSEIEDTYPIIVDVLRELGDNHSFLMTKEVRLQLDKQYKSSTIEYRIINGRIAYLRIPGFIGQGSDAIKFAEEIQEKIKVLDNSSIEGWIVDLTENTGGNMWPMYLGLAPILGEGVCGYFLDSNKELRAWKYHDGAVYEGEFEHLRIKNPYELKNKSQKMAVVIGAKTSSSGEAIAIAFKGYSNARHFGKYTHGLTSGNSVFPLENGVKLVLTTSVFLDRNKIKYDAQIPPDVYADNGIKMAIDWIIN